MRVSDGRMAFVPEGQADRSLARRAWDNATPKRRPVGYSVIRAGVRADSMIGVTKFQMRRLKTFTLGVGLAAPDHTVPYGTVLSRDAFPGTSCLATIMLSLRDEIHSIAEALLRAACTSTIPINFAFPKKKRRALWS
jgi:hypothetical protein